MNNHRGKVRIVGHRTREARLRVPLAAAFWQPVSSTPFYDTKNTG